MGKKRIGFKKPKHGTHDYKNAASSDDDEGETESRLESILDDEIDKYNSEQQSSVLKKDSKSKSKSKARKRQHADSDEEEQEVYGLDVSSEDDDVTRFMSDDSDDDSSEEDNDEDIMGDDNRESGIPDSRAWGRKARAYFNTDYVDQDFGGFEGSDAENAEQEEAEAKEIQKRLTAELDESDFTQFLPPKSDKAKKQSKSDGSKEILKIDFDNLSIAEKRKLIQRECPEVIHMLEELNDKLETAKELKDTMETNEKEEMNSFYQAKYHTILNYCINMSFYLHLRATKPSSCKGHPVVKRILQFRRLLDEINQFKPKVLEDLPRSSKPPKAKKLRKLPPTLTKADQGFGEQLNAKSLKNLPDTPVLAQGQEATELEKRGITYEMSKNKGLAPVRKKEQRNPRVKHRIKYQKAKVRRKGQVRTPRSETKRYDGESFGIKSHVTKSIKLK